MKKSYYLIFMAAAWIICNSTAAWAGPFAVDDYIDKNDSGIVAWATGWENYLPGTHVDTQWQTPDKALGAAVGGSFDIVCLGRGGSITMTFDTPVANGDGADFAVFENSFSASFLELAYVEVSTNGVDFVRFDNYSYTSSPVGGFGSVDASNLYQLAGKHQQGLGTLFDLDMLQYNTGQDASILDLNAIYYIRLVDIVGDGTAFDTAGNIIYDPYPTTGSAGFDLDAIGVLNPGTSAVPVPGTFWLMLSGYVLLVKTRREKS
ncbi:MAG: PEP-CTERM sorting domain-containing protein [Proteobacteria bacterium]|nr:PEP-CTERM sorting domain-containing protein [Pseudomonadota bacterium]MBU1389382.1 PEP-CTERM sorting domain-containing protein [Pseudomonadota bacterium]MBU1541202.1 PEP-CTERM sorting domain-containing protein [Pseudomonadota bacterium]MBU2429101.1 PEP-CTERM sorting domain-containing protein [Pseudomonadota bacterium]MBU2480191.1 PEP-CTERM sorting domain-containing protein [Pseudomonadota bacterium]